METLDDLFLHILKDVYYAEKAISRALPKMAKNCGSLSLADALQNHRDETMAQIERLEQVFQLCGQRAKGEQCEAIKGLIDEGDEIIEEFEKGPVRDAGLLACAQAVEHYEIGRYGALIAWAEAMDLSDVSELLSQTLEEEKAADHLLSELAKSEINPAAMAAQDDEEAETATAQGPSGGSATADRRRRRSA